MSKKILTPHWVIVNWKSHSIWKTPFLSVEEAEKECLKNGLDSDWIIEKHDTFREVEDHDNSGEFSKF